MSLRRRVGAQRHAAPLRQVLAVIEGVHALTRGLSGDARPAIAGGRPVRLWPLPAPRPYGRHELRELRRTLRAQNTSYSDGDAIRRFERELASTWRCAHAIAVSSGTSALHAALIAAEIGPGDEVIVPVLTYPSTALAVLYQGARPRFVDADPLTWNIDVGKIEQAITPRTRAIIPVHLCGVPCDMDAIDAIAARHRLIVIEDAAQAHGASFGGRLVGTCGRLGCLSFQSVKTLSTGEGGAVLTDDDALARRVRLAMNIGESTALARSTSELAHFAPDAALHYELLGWNYRMGALQAALGLGQLRRWPALCAARNANAERLWEQLADLPGVRRQSVPARAAACYSSFFVELTLPDERARRDELVPGLAREHIDCRLPYRKPLAAHALFAHAGDYPAAERLCSSGIGFRVDPSLGRREMDAMGRALRRLLEWWRSHPSSVARSHPQTGAR